MYTPWGEAVTPDDVWPQYPRPHLVRPRWQNLNGLWQYAIRPYHAPAPDVWDGDILVPYPVESALSGVERSVSAEERLWYRRTFTPSPAFGASRILLHFGAVDYEAAIWINGAFVFAHRGGFDPFSIDATEFLRVDGSNVLLVAVWDPSNRGEQPRGKQHLAPSGIWYTAVTGIWQTVWLEPVPRDNHIDELRVIPRLETACVDVEVLLARPTTRTDLAIRVTALEAGRVVASTLAAPDRRVQLLIPDPKRWSPDSPFLYDLTAELVAIEDLLGSDAQGRGYIGLRRRFALRGASEADAYAAATTCGAPVDRVTSYFGMRSIALGAHPDGGHATLLLNGEPVFHLGTLDQGWWPDGLHTPPSDAAIVNDIAFLKAAGFNTLRKHIKVEPARFYHHCDVLGLLVWQDMPSGFAPAQHVAPDDAGEGLRKSTAVEQYELELRRMVNRLQSHPSIVMWVIHNEGWGQFDSKRLADWVKAADPTRLVDAVSGWRDVECGDVLDVHDYAESPTAPKPESRRAVVLGEYGGIGWPIEGHSWNPAIRNWGYQTYTSDEQVRSAYRKKTEAIVGLMQTKGLSGAIYTQTTDVESEVNGLLTYDRRVEKLPREWLAAVHAPLRPRAVD